jgi:hypothetical protein
LARTYSLKKQIPRDVALVVAEELVKALPDTVIVGSLRRGCEVVGDVDLLTSSPAVATLVGVPFPAPCGPDVRAPGPPERRLKFRP